MSNYESHSQQHPAPPTPNLSAVFRPRDFNMYRTASPLPEGPPVMVPPPPAEMLGGDGAVALMVEGTAGHGWMVFDAEGIGREVLLFENDEELQFVDLQLATRFQQQRKDVGDPGFVDFDATWLFEEACKSGHGRPRHVWVQFVPVSRDAGGMRTVEVIAYGQPEAFLVLDDAGDTVDGASMAAPDCQPTEDESELGMAFLERRVAAGDPWFESVAAELPTDAEED